jgi:hypothetical protein
MLTNDQAIDVAEMIRLRLARCPAAVATRLHDEARADAASGSPVTERGRALLESARPWPELGEGAHLGECVCGTSLVFERVAAVVAA